MDEQRKKLKLWVRRKKTGLKLICSRCGQHVPAARIHEVCEREVRDLPCFEYMTTVVVETYRVKCPRCGIRAERVAQLPSKAPYSKRFEEAVGQACESAAARQVARHMGLAASTVRAIDLRYLERWDAKRRQPPLRQMGVDEIYRGKKGKFLTVVCNLETAEPLWFGRERKKETLDDFFRSQLVSRQRKRIEAACVDMWEPFRLSLEEWAPGCRIIYDKFHIIQHANDAVDEVRRAEFFRKGRKMRDLIKGKKWLLVKPLEEPGAETTRRAEPAVPVEPAGVQSLHAQGESGTALGLPLRRCHGQVSGQLGGSIAVAAIALISEARCDVDQALGRHLELLPDPGALWGGRGSQREHSHVDQPRARLSESPLLAAEGQADGRDQRRIHRRSHRQESSLKWPIRRILTQSRFCVAHSEQR